MIIAGSDVWGGDAIEELRAAAEALQVPVFTNGMGRGALPPGETVAKASGIGPALERAFASGVPYLVNVLTDPADAYPRSSTLA